MRWIARQQLDRGSPTLLERDRHVARRADRRIPGAMTPITIRLRGSIAAEAVGAVEICGLGRGRRSGFDLKCQYCCVRLDFYRPTCSLGF